MRIDEESLRDMIPDRWYFHMASIPGYIGRLQTVDVDIESRNKINLFRLDCEYRLFRETIRLVFHVNEFGFIVDTRCSCDDAHGDHGCPHVIHAVKAINDLQLNVTYLPIHIDYLKIIEEKQRKRERENFERYLDYSTDQANQLIEEVQKEAIDDLFENEEQPISMAIKVDIGVSEYPSFTCKVGTSRLFAVKNISALVKQVLDQETVKFGKNTFVTMNYDNFTNESRKIFDFISRYALASEWKKTGVLSSQSIDDFYRLFQDDPSSPIPTKRLKIPIAVQMHRDYVDLEPEYTDGILYFGKRYLYIRDFDGDFFRIECKKQTVSFLKTFTGTNRLTIRKPRFRSFYQEVLQPILSDIEIVTEDDLSEFKTKIKDIAIYADMEDGQVRIWGKYNQNGKRLDLFNRDSVRPVSLIEALIDRYADKIEDRIAVFKTRNQKLFEFLDQGLPRIQECADVYISDALKTLKQRRSLQLSVGMKMKNNLLEIDIQAENVDKDELMSILRMYRRKKPFYKLKSGELLNLQNDALRALDEFVSQYQLTKEDMMADSIERPAYETLRDQEGMEIRKDESVNAYIRQLEALQTAPEFTVRDTYKKLLRPYQMEGVRWMKELHDLGLNGILADDMGLGKTLQVLCLLDMFVSKQSQSLIVCPSSLMFNWESEIDKFNIDLDCVCVNGNQNKRKMRIRENHNLYITTYDYVKRDIDDYADKLFEYVVLDEAQFIKNPKTKNARSVKMLQTKHKLCLTGTPIENRLSELWSIFDFLLPGFLFSLSYFQKVYERPIVSEQNNEVRQRLKRLVTPFILRRSKNEVLDDLPDKEEHTLWLDFEEEEKKLYLANLAQANLELQEQLKMDRVDSIVVLAMMTKLRQICCEPRMLYAGIRKASTKLKMCVDLIETLKENQKKVLLFSSFTRVFDWLIKEFEKKGIQYHLLTGQTSKEKRKEEVDAFQSDDSDVFLISLKAGGTGLNLTHATAVIHFDPWWNISAQNQATDRAYRIGQTKNVLVYQLLMKNTIEAKIYDMQQHKKAVSDIFVENSTSDISQMSAEDLKALFSTK